MTFAIGAWIAGFAGAISGFAAMRLGQQAFSGWRARLDHLMGALVGSGLAVVSYGVFALMEGWAAFFNRSASPVMPLSFTLIMLAGAFAAKLFVERRRGSK